MSSGSSVSSKNCITINNLNNKLFNVSSSNSTLGVSSTNSESLHSQNATPLTVNVNPPLDLNLTQFSTNLFKQLE